MPENPNEKTYGPSWWDVERLQASLRKVYHRDLMINVCPCENPHSGATYWTITIQTAEKGTAFSKSIIGASATFKGNCGAKTITAAIYMALLELDEKLGERQAQAKQAALF
jgi:hypothetical protein